MNREEYGDCENWHLPSKEELETLVEYAHERGYGKNAAGKGKTVAKALQEVGFTGIENIPYWTSTSSRSHADAYWHVVMTDGSLATEKTGTSGVLPVCFSNGENEAIITKGRAIFQEYCESCHDYKDAVVSRAGSGKMRPLEKRKCKFGKNYSTVINGIRNGTSKGMPQYGNVLSPDAVYAVTIYVLTLRCGQGQVF
jgi:mono/diheme cytochrome c family protein